MKEKLKRIRFYLTLLAFSLSITKISVDIYKGVSGKEAIIDEFNKLNDVKLKNPSVGEASYIIDNEVYDIKHAIENLIDGCRLNNMSDIEIEIALGEYFPQRYVNEYFDSNLLEKRKVCIKKYNNN